jgi:hypothetical protein
MEFPDPNLVEQAFYSAFRELDEHGMQAVWVDSKEASCIHPGGVLLRGVEVILDSWREIFDEASPPQVEHRLIQASSDARLAVHTVEEKVSSGAGGRRAVILATNVYIFTDGGWRMLAHHASLPLVESSESTEEAPHPLH